MTIQNINITEIIAEESRFSLKNFLYESGHLEACHKDSFKQQGILCPVIVYRDPSNQFHLIDGRKRFRYAKHAQMKELSAIVLTEPAPVADIITLILCDKKREIEQSVINKILFVCFALHLNAPEAWVLNFLCTSFGFRPHSEFLEDCKRINSLPEEMKHFCHEKNLSMKHILNLAHYPEEILQKLMEWKPALQLTASVLDELASNLKDYLRSRDMTLREFVSETEVLEIIQSAMSPRDKTERLRQLIHVKRFPVLSETNARIQEEVERLNLPKNISLNWDRALENKNIDLVIHIQDPKKMKDLMDILNSTKLNKALDAILDEL